MSGVQCEFDSQSITSIKPFQHTSRRKKALTLGHYLFHTAVRAYINNLFIILIVIIIAFNSASRLCNFLICSLKMWAGRNLEVCVYLHILKIEIKYFSHFFDQSSFIYSGIERCKFIIYIHEVLEIFFIENG